MIFLRWGYEKGIRDKSIFFKFYGKGLRDKGFIRN